ncbi:Glycine/betaine ABC transporter permease [Candidatus Desulfarcum epimagneticum]|uniref:Glycine/betaine ABC transporter permease n=1 Tax=uncultured Desulfobacteraceae bacterium TaxID=218296 RepID=A0A484HGH6_9BACT|nr:Glycine/betaine ABC transporter permease [uncultured Desulfobacteraceae bacterium]
MALYFDRFTIPLDEWIEAAVEWLVTHFRPHFQMMKAPVEKTLNGLDHLLNVLPPPAVILAFTLIAWRFAGKRVALFTAVTLTFIGFLGLWSETMTTLAMVLCAVLFCAAVGAPVGILASRSKRFEAVLRPVLDTMQTTPAFVYLVPVVMLFSIGTVAGVIATIIFSMPPMIRLTSLGIRQVDPELIEAARAFGATPRQILMKVQLPLAMPTIMAGLNQTIMLSLSMVVIAALIGAGGLGLPVFQGLNSLDVGLAGIGGLSIVLMAMVLDRITQSMGSKK